jgi:hypothetical protein
MSTLRATRLNVLDTRHLSAFEPGTQIYPGAADFRPKTLAKNRTLEAALKQLVGGVFRESEFVPVPIEELSRILPLLPFNEEMANMWDPELLVPLLQRLGKRFDGRGYFFYREMKRQKTTLPTGALSGDELSDARRLKAPVLCAFRDSGRGLKSRENGLEYWFPTLVLPSDMATQVYNTSN